MKITERTGLSQLLKWSTITAIALLASVLLSLLAVSQEATVTAETKPLRPMEAELQVSAQAAILMDAQSGRILYEKHSDQPLRVASITKIMTAIVALENGDLKEMVETSSRAYRVEGSSIYLKLGEALTLEDMIYGLMLRSGNDAAVAIAEHIGGSVEGFIYLMNQKAEELGMSQTLFNNPHGLDDVEEHYSSARDMAVLTAYAMQNEDFATIVSTKRKTAPLAGENWDRIWHNKNRLLTMYPYAEGVKTGFTKRAKRTLVSSATKDNHRLIAVTLNAPDDWNDHIQLFEQGFRHYSLVRFTEEGDRLEDRSIPLPEEGYYTYGNSFEYPLLETESITEQVVLDPSIQQSLVEPSQPVGYVYYSLHGEVIGRTPIHYVKEQAEKKPSFWNLFSLVFLRAIGGS